MSDVDRNAETRRALVNVLSASDLASSDCVVIIQAWDALEAERDSLCAELKAAAQGAVTFLREREQKLQEALREIATAPRISSVDPAALHAYGSVKDVARAALAAAGGPQECSPRLTTASEVGLVPDTKEGTDGGCAAAAGGETP